ncbi:MAG TPA: FAD-dependent monooxygenase [Pararobbsia sp.]|nr:FAD-dependent monooxygenase [Pararobbsia sp.]
MQTTADVLIVGAGPVGLLLATLLAREGVDVCIVDRMRERTEFCKALGVTARTLEVFDDIGIVDAAIEAGVWLKGVSFYNNGIPGDTMNVPATDLLPYGALSLAQSETERLLEAALGRHAHKVQYGWALDELTDTPDRVEVRLQSREGKRHDLVCRWVVGCDGAHSRVRSSIGMPFDGGQFPQTFALADLDVAWSLPRGFMYRFNLAGSGGNPRTLAAIPIRGSAQRYRLSTVLPDDYAANDTAAERAPDFDMIEHTMRPLLPEGTSLSSMRWSSVYRVSHRIVPQYRKAHVFLAGDAAHIHPPVGGQGMNTGLQDAYNLAWKLALVLQGRAAPALLDSYSAERHPVGLDVVRDTHAAMNEVLAQQARLPGVRETQLLVGYRGSPHVRDDAASVDPAWPAPGDRAPDADHLRRPFVGHTIRLHDHLTRGRHVLLAYPGTIEAAQGFVPIVDTLRAVFGHTVSGVVILPAGVDALAIEGVTVLTDDSGTFAREYGATAGMVWLVRPDGHIGWRALAPSRAQLAAYLSGSAH